MCRRELTRNRTTQGATGAGTDSLTSTSATVTIPIHNEEETEALLTVNTAEITKDSSVNIVIE